MLQNGTETVRNTTGLALGRQIRAAQVLAGQEQPELAKAALSRGRPALSGAARAVIDHSLELCGGTEAGVYRGYLFPSPRTSGKPVQPGALSLAFYRMAKAIALQDVRTHDLRRTGSTNITSERIGIPRFIVSRVLNQVSDTGGAATVTSVYDRHEYLSEKRRALDAWAALLQSIVNGAGRQTNVVPLKAG